ncbi:hypothetical protein [Chondrinema litorale]|uniref:hypothetical protein n=1 Tax=Chondrinema litorale TaxID=2994555 RepID=UPI002543E610|nr:hypothetical protein [Chondrinema litorale]UZS00060.1 hypothetical protein OQ292_39665 [Chondrinema litorale]
MESFKLIEKKSQIFGVSFQDAFILILFFVTASILGAVVNLFFPIPKWYHLVNVTLLFVGYFVLKRINKKKHATFLMSFISFYLMQPKHLFLEMEDKLQINRVEVKNVKSSKRRHK